MRKNMIFVILFITLLISSLFSETSLEKIKEQGKIRHLGVPYAKFNTGSGSGFSVDLIKLFAEHLGVDYEYVNSSFADIIPDLTGHPMIPGTNKLDYSKNIDIKGDIISTGFTVLPWRAALVNYAEPIFPTQIWIVTRESAKLQPIVPTETIEGDIEIVRKMISGISILGKRGTCLDPDLYNVKEDGAEIMNFEGSVNDLVPAVIDGYSDAVLLDVPDALVGLSKWPGKVKIIGPISPEQHMADAFRKEDKELLIEYNKFLNELKNNGEYIRLIKKYYPNALIYFPEFFKVK